MALTVGGCSGNVDALDPPDAAPQGPVVGDFLADGCSTAVVLGLSIEIADEVACLDPSALAVFSSSEDIAFASAAVLPYLAADAVASIESAAAAGASVVGAPLLINSAFRTVAQQYLLAEWFARGRCGITAAAEPGSSNHESGRAIDISDNAVWAPQLAPYDWDQTVPGDEVHFDHLPSPDNRGLDVLAFQVLWNRNVPGDEIGEDGIYGPATADRLRRAPADGFGVAASCGARLSPKRAAAMGVLADTTEKTDGSNACGI